MDLKFCLDNAFDFGLILSKYYLSNFESKFARSNGYFGILSVHYISNDFLRAKSAVSCLGISPIYT